MKFTVHLGKGSNLHVLKYEKDLSSETDSRLLHNSVKGLNGR